MDSSVSPKDEIWFLRVCHHISNAVYIYDIPHPADHYSWATLGSLCDTKWDQRRGLQSKQGNQKWSITILAIYEISIMIDCKSVKTRKRKFKSFWRGGGSKCEEGHKNIRIFCYFSWKHKLVYVLGITTMRTPSLKPLL